MLLTLFLACGSTRFEGTVVDVTGAPLTGATLTVVGHPCQAIVRADGGFDLPCSPGVYDISLGQSGYISETWSNYEANEQKTYDLGETVLVRIPDENGLLVFKGGSYRAMERGFLVKSSGGRGKTQYRHYCLPENADERMPINPFDAGKVAFFDNASGGWRPWRLDEEGCAYKMSPSSETRWSVDYSDKATWTESELAPEKSLVVMTLEPGRYFISDWSNGFFQKGPTDDEKLAGYGGFYLKVE